MLNFDIIIIGSGGSGLMAAISAVDNGVRKVAVVSKVLPNLSHTVAAKGGINAALGNKTNDDWRFHFYDTIKSSDFIADHDVVEYMCKNAPEAIIKLERMGVVFSRFANGKIYQRAYGGQKTDFGFGEVAYRACSAKDDTGHIILNTLYQQALKRGIKFFNEFLVTDLLMINQDQCLGVAAIDLNRGAIEIFASRTTILATGGHGQIYHNTSTSAICTGDGGAFVLRAGLPLQDMEFVQFHPTGLHGSGLLITEAARGEGGYLLNNSGERFMVRYAPEYQDLASRDVVARAMAKEITENRGCGKNKDHLYLVIKDIDSKIIKERLPGVVRISKSFAGVDVFHQPIPVVPVAHYTMGGIPTNFNCQVINFKECVEVAVQGLMAIGEAACNSVHGANRLGCNSLLDIVVFGELAGKLAANNLVNNNDLFEFVAIKDAANKATNKIKNLLTNEISRDSNCDSSLTEIKRQIKINNEKFCGVFRSSDLLEHGLQNLKAINSELKLIRIKNHSLFWNNELIEYFETENLLLQSLATIYSALNRKESRGAHFRDDFLTRDDKNWRCHSLVFVTNDNLQFKTRPVRTNCGVVDDSGQALIVDPFDRKY